MPASSLEACWRWWIRWIGVHTEPSLCGGDAAFCQIILTTVLVITTHLYWYRWRERSILHSRRRSLRRRRRTVIGSSRSLLYSCTSRPSHSVHQWQQYTALFHDLLLRSYLYHCVWSVITAHNLTIEKCDNNCSPYSLTPTSHFVPPKQHSTYNWHLALLWLSVMYT